MIFLYAALLYISMYIHTHIEIPIINIPRLLFKYRHVPMFVKAGEVSPAIGGNSNLTPHIVSG